MFCSTAFWCDSKRPFSASARLAPSSTSRSARAWRAEAEKGLLESHQKAVEQNNRYLTEAKEQLATIKASVADAEKTKRALEKDIAELEATGRAEAEAAAKDILSRAEEKAASLVRDAETKAADSLKQSREQLAELRAERDAIAEYIESLRAVVGKMTKKAPKKS